MLSHCATKHLQLYHNTMFLRLVTGLCLLEVVFGASCDRTFFTSSSGTVTLPDYLSSAHYANNLNCQYDIRVGSGNAIRLTWTSFDIKGKMPSCYTDYVEIFIGCNYRRSIGRYCSENSDTTPFDVYSPDNCLRLKFKSDSSGTGKGFTATYSTVSYIFGTSSLSSSCSSSESKYSDSGVINSPRWPRVYRSTGFGSCYWKIEVGSNKAVKIAFMDFDLDYDIGCDDDKVKVKGGRSYDSYDKSSTVKDSMCGSKSPFYLTSTKDRIWIRFKSDGSRSNRGFVAGYVTYSDSSSSGSTSGGMIGGIAVAVIVFICIGGVIYYVIVHRRRVAMRQAAHHQAMTTQVNVASQQAVVHHPPPPTQPGYGPPPPAGYGPPPPMGYIPPPADGSAVVAPPPYAQVVGAPYPPQDKSGPYPPPGAAPYPPGQPGGMAPYPPEPSTGAVPYPTGPPGAAPYPPN